MYTHLQLICLIFGFVSLLLTYIGMQREERSRARLEREKLEQAIERMRAESERLERLRKLKSANTREGIAVALMQDGYDAETACRMSEKMLATK